MTAAERPQGDIASLVLEHIEDVAIVVADQNGIVEHWFHGAEFVFGYSAEEIVGRSLEILFTPEDVSRGVPRHEIEVAIATGRAMDDRWEVRKDGTRIWVTGVLMALRDGRGDLRGLVKIMRERTDIRAQIESLESRIAARDRAARGNDEFLSKVAHELRNSLAPVVTTVAILRRRGVTQWENDLRVIERHLALMRRLIDDLMDVRRIAAGKVQLERRRIALDDVLRSAAAACRPLAEARNQRFDVLLLPSTIAIEADADRLHQVFLNLLENAVKYTPEHGRISLTATLEGEEAVVRVADSGIGIAAEALPKIFDLFTQEESAREMAEGGLGLGLSVVRDLVVLHGGTIAVRSEGRGKGSEFIVRLPSVS